MGSNTPQRNEALSQRNEALPLELLEEHRVLLRPLVPCFNGTGIKTARSSPSLLALIEVLA